MRLPRQASKSIASAEWNAGRGGPIAAPQRRELRPARRAAAVAAEGQHQLARPHNFRPARRLQRPAQQAGLVVPGTHRHPVVDRQADRLAHPQQVVAPVDPPHLVQGGPARLAMLRLVPGAEGQRRHAEVRSCEVLGTAKGDHARVGAPGAFLAARGTVDHAQVGHAFAQQRIGGGLAAHAGAGNQHVQHWLAVGAVRGRHPVGRREVQPRQVGTRVACKPRQRGLVAGTGDGLWRHRGQGGRRHVHGHIIRG